MKLLKRRYRRFWTLEDGLITVEWVALTAGMVIAAVVIGFVVMKNTYRASSQVGGGIMTSRNAIFGPNGSKLTGS